MQQQFDIPITSNNVQQLVYLCPGEQQQSTVDALVAVAVVKVNVRHQLILAIKAKPTVLTRMLGCIVNQTDVVLLAHVTQQVVPVIERSLKITPVTLEACWTLTV